MTFSGRKLAVGLLATSAIFFSVAAGQAQQGVDAAREFCLGELGKMYPNQQPDSTNRAALSYYQQCMRNRGFTP